MIENLRVLRESKGYTQQLAELIGVTQQSIQKYETQKHEPDITSLMMIADVFEVSVDYLIGHTASGKDPNYGISTEEYHLIERYRKLDAPTRDSLRQILNGLSTGKPS